MSLFVYFIYKNWVIFFEMIFEIYLNNLFTHRDRRLKGLTYVKGLASFLAVCSIGALTNVLVADSLFDHAIPWWAAGLLGAIVGSGWNYAVASSLVWKRNA